MAQEEKDKLIQELEEEKKWLEDEDKWSILKKKQAENIAILAENRGLLLSQMWSRVSR